MAVMSDKYGTLVQIWLTGVKEEVAELCITTEPQSPLEMTT
jgi:hypothetical protein